MRSGQLRQGDIVEVDVYLGGFDFNINPISFEELCKCRIGTFLNYRDYRGAIYNTRVKFDNGESWNFPERYIKKIKGVE